MRKFPNSPREFKDMLKNAPAKYLKVDSLVKAASEKLSALAVNSPIYKKIVNAAKSGVDVVMLAEVVRLKQELKDWRTVDKMRAVQLFKEIQDGRGLYIDDFPKEMKGRVAKKIWNDPDFHYGMEYGALVVLRRFFKITPEDLK